MIVAFCSASFLLIRMILICLDIGHGEVVMKDAAHWRPKAHEWNTFSNVNNIKSMVPEDRKNVCLVSVIPPGSQSLGEMNPWTLARSLLFN